MKYIIFIFFLFTFIFNQAAESKPTQEFTLNDKSTVQINPQPIFKQLIKIYKDHDQSVLEEIIDACSESLIFNAKEDDIKITLDRCNVSNETKDIISTLIESNYIPFDIAKIILNSFKREKRCCCFYEIILVDAFTGEQLDLRQGGHIDDMEGAICRIM